MFFLPRIVCNSIDALIQFVVFPFANILCVPSLFNKLIIFTATFFCQSGLQDRAEDLQAIDSCEYIWEKGVGFAQSPPRTPSFETARTELLKLVLTCFSETMYHPPAGMHQKIFKRFFKFRLWHTWKLFLKGCLCDIRISLISNVYFCSHWNDWIIAFISPDCV